ncbi:hypothetical protein SAZ10_29670 [Mesorhizobium sp. BAC0120]|uniref:hypothetical protein n=1 Tax=Mesorhizobium sp. BAC0120 TaxID=3090670 RepID=UPI00298BE318|nr:hypothetical protein [Mesorhizobium sp. BAC0120]MDW6025935.1 hypothetical protein [Mesorhizobium sp. BAC0120]
MGAEQKTQPSLETSTETARDLDGRPPINEASYRGWLIRYWNSGEWIAQLFEPGSIAPLPDQVVASLDEGEVVLVQRAQRKIDGITPSE